MSLVHNSLLFSVFFSSDFGCFNASASSYLMALQFTSLSLNPALGSTCRLTHAPHIPLGFLQASQIQHAPTKPSISTLLHYHHSSAFSFARFIPSSILPSWFYLEFLTSFPSSPSHRIYPRLALIIACLRSCDNSLIALSDTVALSNKTALNTVCV